MLRMAAPVRVVSKEGIDEFAGSAQGIERNEWAGRKVVRRFPRPPFVTARHITGRQELV